jgi:hypothetical protein
MGVDLFGSVGLVERMRERKEGRLGQQEATATERKAQEARGRRIGG